MKDGGMEEENFDIKEMNAALGLLKLVREGREPGHEADMRTRKTVFQMMVLKEVFMVTQHPSTLTKMDLALMIKLPFKAVQIWFQNERSKREEERGGCRDRGLRSEDIDPTRLLRIIMKVLDRGRDAGVVA